MTKKKENLKTGFFPMATDVERAKPKSTEIKADGWTNVLTGLGRKGRDRSQGTSMTAPDLLTPLELLAMYQGDGPATRIVDSVAEDMTRNGWRIAGDDAEETLYKTGEKMELTARVCEAEKWRRLFGGAIIIKHYENDGASLAAPVRPGAKLVRLKVYPCTMVDLHESTFSTNPRSPYYEDIEIFAVRKKFSADTMRVHASRVEVLKGRALPAIREQTATLAQQYWGMSALQAPYQALSILGAFVQGIGHAGQEMAVSKYRLSNLMQILAENSTDALYARMEAIELSKSLINAVLLGKDEEWGRDQLSFVGLPEVFDRLAMMVSGACAIPVTKIFGRSAAGLNATGEGDTRDYYDLLNSRQTNDLAPLLSRLYAAIKSSVKDFEMMFNPVWTPTQAELIEMRSKQALTDEIYAMKIVDAAGKPVITIEELRRSRFGGGYGFETVLGTGTAATIEGGV